MKYIATALITAAVLFLFFGIRSERMKNSYEAEIKQLQSQRDSIKFIKDSLDILIFEKEKEWQPQKLDSIKPKINAKVNSVRYLPIDSAVLFFTEWATESDSSGQ